jgi:hypothetical protein
MKIEIPNPATPYQGGTPMEVANSWLNSRVRGVNLQGHVEELSPSRGGGLELRRRAVDF